LNDFFEPYKLYKFLLWIEGLQANWYKFR